MFFDPPFAMKNFVILFQCFVSRAICILLSAAKAVSTVSLEYYLLTMEVFILALMVGCHPNGRMPLSANGRVPLSADGRVPLSANSRVPFSGDVMVGCHCQLMVE